MVAPKAPRSVVHHSPIVHWAFITCQALCCVHERRCDLWGSVCPLQRPSGLGWARGRCRCRAPGPWAHGSFLHTSVRFHGGRFRALPLTRALRPQLRWHRLRHPGSSYTVAAPYRRGPPDSLVSMVLPSVVRVQAGVQNVASLIPQSPGWLPQPPQPPGVVPASFSSRVCLPVPHAQAHTGASCRSTVHPCLPT